MVNDPFSRIRPRRGGDLTHELSITFLQALEGVLVEAEIAGKTVCARIPPGVDTGSIVRLSGCGAPGLRGGPRGDLYFVVNVQPDERFLRHGDDIFATLPLSREEAEKGVKIEAPAPDGKVLVKVPPNTMDETIFRFRGRGFPSPDGNGRGDYLIKVSVV
jgi:DnaJ-class molecular chaperone